MRVFSWLPAKQGNALISLARVSSQSGGDNISLLWPPLDPKHRTWRARELVFPTPVSYSHLGSSQSPALNQVMQLSLAVLSGSPKVIWNEYSAIHEIKWISGTFLFMQCEGGSFKREKKSIKKTWNDSKRTVTCIFLSWRKAASMYEKLRDVS